MPNYSSIDFSDPLYNTSCIRKYDEKINSKIEIDVQFKIVFKEGKFYSDNIDYYMISVYFNKTGVKQILKKETYDAFSHFRDLFSNNLNYNFSLLDIFKYKTDYMRALHNELFTHRF